MYAICQTVLLAACVAAACAARPAGAQEAQGDVHANYSRGTDTGTNAWGAGINFQLTFGGKAPLNLGTSAGLDYLKQEDGGPGQVNLSYDAVLQPGGDGSITPYAGGSVSANWSVGDAKQWDGAKLGLDAIAGLQFTVKALGDLSWKLEERFGYVRGQEHTLGTRRGVAISF